jgi:ATP-dependent DNA helicase RecG
VISPGTLPAHITPDNILRERFSRNGTIVRLINKFPNPPNKDVGEGLNTAFAAMRDMKLKQPAISQDGVNVQVVLKHEPLATPEEIILEYLKNNPRITNRVARSICYEGSENKMKRILQGLVKNMEIELVPGTTRSSAAYRRKSRDISVLDTESLSGKGLSRWNRLWFCSRRRTWRRRRCGRQRTGRATSGRVCGIRAT